MSYQFRAGAALRKLAQAASSQRAGKGLSSGSDSTGPQHNHSKLFQEKLWNYLERRSLEMDSSHRFKVYCPMCHWKANTTIYRARGHLSGLVTDVKACPNIDGFRSGIKSFIGQLKREADTRKAKKTLAQVVANDDEEHDNKGGNQKITAWSNMSLKSSRDAPLTRLILAHALPISLLEFPYLENIIWSAAAMGKAATSYVIPQRPKLMGKLLFDKVGHLLKEQEPFRARMGIQGATSSETGEQMLQRGLFQYSSITVKMRPDNIVQAVMDGAAVNESVQRTLIEDHFPAIFMSTCMAHTSDLVLEVIGKIVWMKEVLSGAKTVVDFFRRHTKTHHWLLRVGKKPCCGQLPHVLQATSWCWVA